jgi:hypothetical protein
MHHDDIMAWQRYEPTCVCCNSFFSWTHVLLLQILVYSVLTELNVYFDCVERKSINHPLHPLMVSPFQGTMPELCPPRPWSRSLELHAVNGTALRDSCPGHGTSVSYCTKPIPVCRQL